MSITFRLPGGREVQRGESFVLAVPVGPSKFDAVTFPANWLELASPGDLARFGITKQDIADPPPTATELTAYAASKRRALVNGAASVNVGSRTIPTWVDPESRGSITGLVVALQFVPTLTAPWKGSDGAFYTLTPAEMPVLALGMMQFVQECFASEGIVAAEIAAATITTFAQIDAYAWPSAT